MPWKVECCGAGVGRKKQYGVFVDGNNSCDEEPTNTEGWRDGRLDGGVV